MDFGVKQIPGDENLFLFEIQRCVALAMAVTVLRALRVPSLESGFQHQECRNAPNQLLLKSMTLT